MTRRLTQAALSAAVLGACLGAALTARASEPAGYVVAVTRDLNGVRAMLQKMLPRSDVRVDGVGDGVMLTGMVANAAESQQAADVAAKLVGSADKVVNNLSVRERDQVMLKVTV